MEIHAANPDSIVNTIARVREHANLFIEQELRQRNIDGILPAHGSVLAFLFSQTEPVPLKAVVDSARRAKSTITGIIKTLEQNGYVQRTDCYEDARSTRVSLTAKGMGLRSVFEEISQELLVKIYGDMPEMDRRTLATFLSTIEDNMKR